MGRFLPIIESRLTPRVRSLNTGIILADHGAAVKKKTSLYLEKVSITLSASEGMPECRAITWQNREILLSPRWRSGAQG